jgi:hypothetical protein
MYCSADVLEVLKTTGRLLIFKPGVPDLRRLGPLYLAIGLIFVCLAGIARHWDDPRADLWQRLGLGSIVYAFAFAALLWLLLWPLRPRNWRYTNVLVFMTLTALPAVLYALPGRFLPAGDIPTAQMGLVGLVSAWRVGLLWCYLRGSAGLTGAGLVIALCLPLALVITTLSVLNFGRPVFDIMGGKMNAPSGNAYAVLLSAEAIAIPATPVLLLLYAWFCWRAWQPAAKAAAE